MKKKKLSWKTTLLGVLVAVGSIAVPFIPDARVREIVSIAIGVGAGGIGLAAKDSGVGTNITDDAE